MQVSGGWINKHSQHVEQLNNLKQNGIWGRCNTTGTILDRQRGKFQMNLPQRSLARWARQPWVCPFGNAERFGHCLHLGASQEVLREERWSLTLLGNQITSKCTHRHRLSQQNKNTQYSLNKHQAFLPLCPISPTWDFLFFFLPYNKHILVFKYYQSKNL